MEPRNRFQGMNSASLCSLAGRYANHVPPRFLAPIDSLKIPAQDLHLCYHFSTKAKIWFLYKDDLLLNPFVLFLIFTFVFLRISLWLTAGRILYPMKQQRRLKNKSDFKIGALYLIFKIKHWPFSLP
jgi:hypothetical protein